MIAIRNGFEVLRFPVKSITSSIYDLGEVTQVLGPDTYEVERPHGGTYRRNHVYMRVTKITPKIHDKPPTVTSRTPEVAPATPPS